MFEAVEGMRAEHADLEGRLSLPETHADQRLAKQLNQRYAELTAVVTTWRDWQRLAEDIEAARELASDDPTFAEEAEALAAQREVAAERLRRLLVPRDAADGKDALLEIKSGEGGEESALFAGDLLRMYTRYAETRGWTVEVLDANESDLGGFKSVTAAVKARGTAEPGQAQGRALDGHGRVTGGELDDRLADLARERAGTAYVGAVDAELAGGLLVRHQSLPSNSPRTPASPRSSSMAYTAWPGT